MCDNQSAVLNQLTASLVQWSLFVILVCFIRYLSILKVIEAVHVLHNEHTNKCVYHVSVYFCFTLNYKSHLSTSVVNKKHVYCTADECCGKKHWYKHWQVC